MTALLVEELTVNYEETSVLWNLGFSIPKGLLVGIIGPNGAGKSTLLKSLLGMVKPLSGHIEFFGKPLKKVRHKIAYVPQHSSVDWDFPVSALDVVLMGRYNRLPYFKWPRAADKEAAMRALELLGIQALANRQIRQLSGGQRQRLFLARAFVQEADIYLMDEPFAGVDMATEKLIISFLDKLKMAGKTLFIVHHDLSTVDSYFDWVIMLNTSLIACGPVEEVFHADSLARTYGRNVSMLEKALQLTGNKTSGLR